MELARHLRFLFERKHSGKLAHSLLGQNAAAGSQDGFRRPYIDRYECVLPRDDNEIDAERCRICLREKSPITLLIFDSAGRWLVCLSAGVVRAGRGNLDRTIGGVSA